MEEIDTKSPQLGCPRIQRKWGSRPALEREQHVAKPPEPGDERRITEAWRAPRQQPPEHVHRIGRRCEPEEQAVEAGLPRVQGLTRKVELCTVFRVDAPPNARRGQQIGEARALVLGEAEILPHRARVHEPNDVEHGKARVEHLQHGQELVVERRIIPRLAVVHLEWDPRALPLSEHRAKDGRVGVEVRCHHDDVLGAQLGIVLEGPADQIVQHLRLSHWTGARVERDRAVALMCETPLVGLWRLVEAENVGLNRVQQARTTGLDEEVRAFTDALVDRNKDLLEVARQAPDVDEEGVAVELGELCRSPLRFWCDIPQVRARRLQRVDRGGYGLRERAQEPHEERRKRLEREQVKPPKLRGLEPSARTKRGHPLLDA